MSGGEPWRAVADEQGGVISRAQAVAAGLTADQVRHRLRSGRWQRVHPGVYATHGGALAFPERSWAGALHAGPDAVLSHRSAGRLQGLVDDDPDDVEVAVPWSHRVEPRPGIRVRRSREHQARRHPHRTVPQTRVEDTVLDLVEICDKEVDVVGWLTRACQRRLTTPQRLREAAARRRRMRHRRLVAQVLADVRAGVASPLEHAYRRGVERAHGLPHATRNEATVVDGRRWFHDVRYGRWQVRVELEGLAYHRADAGWRDDARDNAAVLGGDAVLRFGWRAVVSAPCTTAGEVASVLHARGWTGSLRRCGPLCPVARTDTPDR